MKRRMTLTLVLTLSLVLSLVSLPSTAQGQQPQRFRADSGLIVPGPNLILRVTVAGTGANDTIRVRFRWMQYGAESCSGMPTVCRHMVTAEGTTPPETLGPNDALSIDTPATGDGVRVVVESNSRNARVLGIVFDHSTQRVVSFFNTEMLALN